MGIKHLFIILLALTFSIFSFAAQPDPAQLDETENAEIQEPYEHTFGVEKPYYQMNEDKTKASYGYDNINGCTTELCVKPNSTFTCGSYAYVGAPQGRRIQFCHVKTIDGQDVQDQQYTIATGTIETTTGIFKKKEVFRKALADQESFMANNKKKQIAYESKAVPTENTGRVCLPGEDCEKGIIGTLVDFGKDIIHKIMPEPKEEVPEVVDLAPASPAYKKMMGDFISDRLKHPPGKQIATLCSSFTKPDGELGPWGQQTISAMKSVCNECFFGPKHDFSKPGRNGHIGLGGLCPRFDSFSQAEREYFWVWAYTSMAHVESSCKKNVEVKGQFDRAVGLLQLEKSPSKRRYRGPECQTNGQTVFDTRFQFRCAASIIKDTRWDDGKNLYGKSPGKRDQYWHRLFTLDGKISKYIALFPGCHKPLAVPTEGGK